MDDSDKMESNWNKYQLTVNLLFPNEKETYH